MENVFRFARFEADRERYQLRSGSRTIKLERIPLELLFLLLEHREKLVSREQIVARLWCDESFMDTERSINTAVRKIRRALGDDPRHPRFVGLSGRAIVLSLRWSKKIQSVELNRTCG